MPDPGWTGFLLQPTTHTHILRKVNTAVTVLVLAP